MASVTLRSSFRATAWLALAAMTVPLGAQSAATPEFVALGRVRSMANQPFRAEWVTTRVQTLADGSQITDVDREVRVRDVEGRVRIERFAPENGTVAGKSAAPVSVEIVDPIAGQTIRLSPLRRTATIIALAQPTPLPHTPMAHATLVAPASQLPRPQFERLGTQSIDGMDAIGTRITQVIPAGAQGNDHDLTIVHESWFSPELKIDLLTKHSDPRSGEATTEVRNLSLDDPDPALFRIPEGYTVAAPPVQ